MLQVFYMIGLICHISHHNSFSIVANEATLLSSSNFELDVGRAYRRRDFNVYHSIDSCAWFIEWILCLQLDSALGKPASVV